MQKIIFAFAVFIMAQIKIPYQNPTYGSDLMAKEIINGTYYAAIDMKITNTQTGHERYVRVEDSLPEKISRGESIESVTPRVIDSNIPSVDRERMLEDAVLPRYIDKLDSLPDIASKSQCPTGLTYLGEYEIGEVNVNLKRVCATKDDLFFLAIDRYLYDSWYEGYVGTAHYILYRLDGLQKEVVAEFEQKETYIDWVDISDGQIFIKTSERAGSVLYRLDGSTFVKVMDVSADILSMVIASGGKHYVADVSNATKVIFRCIEGCGNLEYAWRDEDERATMDSYTRKSIAGAGFTTSFSKTTAIAIIDSKAINVKARRDFKHLYASFSRFDYDGHRARYNDMMGKVGYPKSKYNPMSWFRNIGAIRSEIISNILGKVGYTRDFVNEIDSGIVWSNYSDYAITKSHLYFFDEEKIMAIKIDGWSTVIPDARYGELFAKEGLLDSQIINSGRYPQVE